MIYLDSCAFVKLLRVEQESPALHSWLTKRDGEERVSSTLLEVEAARSLIRTGPPAALLALAPALAKMHRVEITAEVRQRATSFPQTHLRSLDAIHLATGELLRAELTAFVTYDKRLWAAAEDLGLPVEAPA